MSGQPSAPEEQVRPRLHPDRAPEIQAGRPAFSHGASRRVHSRPVPVGQRVRRSPGLRPLPGAGCSRQRLARVQGHGDVQERVRRGGLFRATDHAGAGVSVVHAGTGRAHAEQDEFEKAVSLLVTRDCQIVWKHIGPNSVLDR